MNSFCACNTYNSSLRKLIIIIFMCTLWDISTYYLHHKNNKNTKQNQHNVYHAFQISQYFHITHITLPCLSCNFLVTLLIYLQILSFYFPTSSQTLLSFLFALVWCFFLMNQTKLSGWCHLQHHRFTHHAPLF